jgi:hypothetical protein
MILILKTHVDCSVGIFQKGVHIAYMRRKHEDVYIVSKTLLARQKKLELRGLNPAFSSSNAKLMHVLARLPDFFRL